MNHASSDVKLELVGQSESLDMSPDLDMGFEEELLTIGAMAKLCDVTVRTLRYYEEVDLIGPIKRTSGKYRLYNHRTVKRVKAILALQDLNYTLDEIQSTLGRYSQTVNFTKDEQVKATRDSLVMQKDIIESKLKALLEMKTDVELRLHLLDNACAPCLKDQPKDQCHDSCTHRDVHMN